MFAPLRVAVVVPAFQEERLVGQTLRSIPGFVDDVVVVDDASRDDTSAAATRVGDPRVTVIRHAENRGVGAAIVTGYKAARKKRADVVVVMAGDGQMDPVDLPALIAPIARGEADYVKGNRLVHPEARQMPLVRRLGTRAFGAMTARAIGHDSLGDSQCGYTAISGALLDRLPLDAIWPRYGYPNDLLGWAAVRGARIREVPVRPVYATEASGLRPWHGLVILGLVARARLRRWNDKYTYSTWA